jgi:DNA-binding response OmpR family regulator
VLREERGTVHRGSQQLPLTVTEFRLLCELAGSPGRVLSRQELLERVWQHGFFGDERIVDVHIRRLRTKVEQDPGAPRIVVTVRGLGYRLDPQ